MTRSARARLTREPTASSKGLAAMKLAPADVATDGERLTRGLGTRTSRFASSDVLKVNTQECVVVGGMSSPPSYFIIAALFSRKIRCELLQLAPTCLLGMCLAGGLSRRVAGRLHRG